MSLNPCLMIRYRCVVSEELSDSNDLYGNLIALNTKPVVDPIILLIGLV